MWTGPPALARVPAGQLCELSFRLTTQTDTGGVLGRSYFTDVPLCRVGTYGNDAI